MLTEITLAFLLGLSSSSHCLMMCGGISASLYSSVSQYPLASRMLRNSLFHFGRISCYSVLGFFIGDLLIRLTFGNSPDLVFYSRFLTGFMLIIIGAYILGYAKMVRLIEGRLAFVWVKVQPVVQYFKNRAAGKLSDAYIIGFLWGFLPCGILYSALLWASSQLGGTSAGVLMFFFGLGTIPALFSSSVIIQKLLIGRGRKVLGCAVIVFGLWTIIAVIMPMQHQHTSHADMPTTQETMPAMQHSHMHHE